MSKLNSLFLKLKMMAHIREVNMFFSQTGEDILINGVLQNQPNGFYVDVGAYDPIKFSNTYGFYLKGWRGINIDPNPESIKRFNHKRHDDINVNVGISDVPGELTYYNFKEAAFNTFSSELVKSYKTAPLNSFPVKLRRLDDVLNEFLPPGQPIDLMSIDVEGLDLNVLKSNDWKKYRPRVIAVEFSQTDNSIDEYLREKGYESMCNTILTRIYRDKSVAL